MLTKLKSPIYQQLKTKVRIMYTTVYVVHVCVCMYMYTTFMHAHVHVHVIHMNMYTMYITALTYWQLKIQMHQEPV